MPVVVEQGGRNWHTLKLGVCVSDDRRFVREEGSDDVIYLSPTESTLFYCLASHAPGLITNDQAIFAIWGNCRLPECIEKGLHVRVTFLRKKLRAHWRIDCLREYGYKLARITDPPMIGATARTGRAARIS